MAKQAPPNRGGTKYGSMDHTAPGRQSRFSSVDAQLLADCVDAVTADGDCIMLGLTSDGGACHVRVLADGLVEKWYASSSPELTSTLQGILDAARRSASAR